MVRALKFQSAVETSQNIQSTDRNTVRHHYMSGINLCLLCGAEDLTVNVQKHETGISSYSGYRRLPWFYFLWAPSFSFSVSVLAPENSSTWKTRKTALKPDPILFLSSAEKVWTDCKDWFVKTSTVSPIARFQNLRLKTDQYNMTKWRAQSNCCSMSAGCVT